MASKFKKAIIDLPIIDGKNTIITAHGGVIDRNLFKNNDAAFPFKLTQGGFYVISKVNNGLKIEHEFSKFEEFSKKYSQLDDSKFITTDIIPYLLMIDLAC